MALYLVLHHRLAPKSPHYRWSNAWLDDDRIDAITTTAEIGTMCEAAKKRGDEIFIHRCAYGDPVISCAAQVKSVAPFVKGEALVQFTNQRVLLVAPVVKPNQGDSSYTASPPVG